MSRSLLSERQCQLLVSACGDIDRARQAWLQWSQVVNIAELELSEYRVLPVVYDNLRDGAELPLLDHLKSIYRRSWTQQQLLLHALSALLDILDKAGIPFAVSGEAGAYLSQYAPEKYRPLERLDLILAPDDIARALSLLESQEWLPVGAGDCMDFRCFTTWPASQLTLRSAARTLVIHVEPLPGLFPGECVLRRLKDAQLLGARAVRLPSAAQQFLLTCNDAWTGGPNRLIDLVDARQLIGSGGPDWDRVTREATRLHFSLPVAATLQCLEEMGMQPPAALIGALATARPEAWERLRYDLRPYTPAKPGWGVRLGRLLGTYVQTVAWRRRSASLGSFVDFLRCRWGLRSTSQVFRKALAKLASA